MHLTPNQAAVLQAVVDRKALDLSADVEAVQQCLASGYLFEADGTFILTLAGIDALRPLQPETPTVDALQKIFTEAVAFDLRRNS